MLRATLEQLAEGSVSAVIARVGASRVETEEGMKRIWTVVSLDVEETLLGPKLTELEVSVVGGQVGEVEQHVHGTPELERGTRVALFLWRDGERMRVLGMAQGCLHVRRVGIREMCAANTDDLTLVEASGRRTARHDGPIELSELRERVGKVRLAREAAERRRQERLAKRLAAARERAERRQRTLAGRPGTSTPPPETPPGDTPAAEDAEVKKGDDGEAAGEDGGGGDARDPDGR